MNCVNVILVMQNSKITHVQRTFCRHFLKTTQNLFNKINMFVLLENR